MTEKAKKLIAYLLDRLGESSTIQGVAAILTLVVGHAIDPKQTAAWTAAAALLSGVLKVVLPDRLRPKK